MLVNPGTREGIADLPTPDTHRRLVTVIMADIVGYTRLMGENEDATLDAWYACRNNIIDPKIDYFRGRIVKHTGDGFLAEFPSVIDAMNCAIEMQTGLEKRNNNAPEESRLLFRMGLNLCDIIADEEDIYGEGVNTAARVEALAAPGTICITSAVHDQVGSKVKADFEDLGAKKLKNVAKRVRVFQVWPPGNFSGNESDEEFSLEADADLRTVSQWTQLAAAVFIVAGIAAIVWVYMSK